MYYLRRVSLSYLILIDRLIYDLLAEKELSVVLSPAYGTEYT